LRTLSEVQQDRECQREQDKKILSNQQRAAILSLATDFPRLWRDANTPDRERKRMIRLLLEDVTLVRGVKITLHIRFKGGATKTLMAPAPLNAWQHRATNPTAVKEIDRLLDHHTYQQIVSILNERGLRSGEGKSFLVRIVARIQKRYDLMPRYDRSKRIQDPSGLSDGDPRPSRGQTCRERTPVGSRLVDDPGLFPQHFFKITSEVLSCFHNRERLIRSQKDRGTRIEGDRFNVSQAQRISCADKRAHQELAD
jgi:hypothetical protein